MNTVESNQGEALRNAVFLLKRAQAQVKELEAARTEPLAVIGIGCRFPGGGDTPEAFWRSLCQEADGICEVPSDRWDIEAYYDERPGTAGKMNTRWGGFLEQVDGFDADFFGISQREAMRTDPQQRLLLEVAWEAMESAGYPPPHLARSKMGVFVGIIGNDYAYIQSQDQTQINAFTGTGNAHSIAANRLSYLFDFRGPSVALDTACSSSLVGVHLACQSLRQGESDMALAGGVNLILRPEMTIALSQAQMLSPDGHCKAFDASANGYVRGEGCGLVLLKRLRDAVADGDHILAVIRGTAVNQDGRSNGISAPNGAAQEAVIYDALANAQVEPQSISYVETHGTGTSLGDPIEVEALLAVLGKGRQPDNPLTLGAVKSNIGHLESAAGIAALIKVIMALQHGAIPPNLHMQKINPNLDFAGSLIEFPTELTEWPRNGQARFAGISSFGFGGTNAHLILAEAPTSNTEVKATELPERSRHILALSARSETALAELAGRYARFLESNPDCALPDLTYSANIGRAHLEHRAAINADSSAALHAELQALAEGQTTPILHTSKTAPVKNKQPVFLFTGQGAQYAQMGNGLFQTQPVFRSALIQCDELLRPHLEKPLLSVIQNETNEGSLLHQTVYTQPALFALEYALGQMWMSWGIKPCAVMGHSVGEYVAACLAGVFTLEDGLYLISQRARLMQALPAGGCMEAVLASAAQVDEAIKPYKELAIAAYNGPRSHVISGEREAVKAVVAQLKSENIECKPLKTSHAFHSPLMEPMLEEFQQLIAKVKFSPPQYPVISNLTGKTVDFETMADPAYWRNHIRQPVRFHQSIKYLSDQGHDLFLELGPKPTLIGMAQQCLSGSAATWLAALRQGRDDWEMTLNTLGTLYTHGLDIDWQKFEQDRSRKFIELPTYPFQRKRLWSDTTRAEGTRGTAGNHTVQATGHPLLGDKLHLPTIEQIFEAQLSAGRPSLLTDHVVLGKSVMPGTAYLELALAAAHHLERGPWMLQNVNFLEPLLVDAQQPTTVQTVIVTESTSSASFKIISLVEESSGEAYFITHAVGKLRKQREAAITEVVFDAAEQQTRIGGEAYDDTWRTDKLRRSGLTPGPQFTWITSHWMNERETLGQVRALRPGDQAEAFVLHPGLIDCGLQLLGAVLPTAGSDTYIFTGAQRMRVIGKPEGKAWYHTQITELKGDITRGDVRLYSSEGRLLLEIEDATLQRVSRDWLARTLGERDPKWLYQLAWQPEPLSAQPASEPGRWLIIEDSSGLGQALSGQLQACGASCESVAPPATPEAMQLLVQEKIKEATIPIQGIVHLSSLDVGEPNDCSPEDLNRARTLSWGNVLDLVHALTESPPDALPRLCLITCGAQGLEESNISVAVAQAPLWGFARVIAAEHPELNCTRIDLDPTEECDTHAGYLAAELLASEREDQIIYRNGERHVARLVSVENDSAAKLRVPQGQPYRLEITERGELENLALRPTTRFPVGSGEVEIQVEATGLNFRDVLNVLDLYPGDPGPLGGECAGRVVAIGEGVKDIAVGDEVFGLAPASYSQYVTTLAQFVQPKPPGMSFEEAATLPIAFLTTHYALRHLGNITQGDRVLIHSASGGVGLAAVQIAQQFGAEIFATAGNAQKRQFVRELGIEHVMDSRSLDFADEIKQATGDRGVDLVLNALTGEAIAKSLSVMADEGHFLEIGKTDLWDQKRVAAVNPTLHFHAIALDRMMAEQPELVGVLMKELTGEFERHRLQPLPLKAFPIEEAVAAFRYMARAKHIGKIVITSASDARQPVTEVAFRKDATYLITGGLGGLGLKFARWLVEHGARHLALTGRSGASSSVQPALEELRSLGAVVRVIRADVSRRADVERLLTDIRDRMPPLYGILHAAGTLDDGIIREQTRERFDRVMAPKVLGALHLHTLTRDLPIEHFVLFSSAASLLGSPGQANYAAANAFLDALAHQRCAQGLAAQAINWGAWAEVGMAAELDRAQGNRREAAGVERIEVVQGLTTFGRLLERGNVQIGVLSIDWPSFLEKIPVGMEPPWLSVIAAANRGATEEEGTAPSLLIRLQDLTPAEQLELVKGFVREQAAHVMGSDLAHLPDPARPLNELGFDSLMGVELCNAISGAVGHHLQPTVLFDHPTLGALADYLAKVVLHIETPEAQMPESEVIEAPNEQALSEVEGLSEEDLDALITEELAK